MSLEDDLNAIVDQGDTKPPRRNSTASTGDPFNEPVAESGSKIKPRDRIVLCRELAVGEVKRVDLARKYGVSSTYITKFARQHAAQIDAIRQNLDDEFAGLWIADKKRRIAQYEADLEVSDSGDYAGHYEQIRTRTQILRAVAEELGQLPPRATIAVVPVTHIIEGVDLDGLK